MDLKTVGTVFFTFAFIHSFCAPLIAKLAVRNQSHSWWQRCLHWLSEVEIIFGFWAFLFLVCMAFALGFAEPFNYVNTLSMTEPIFIFCIMMIASTKPFIWLAENFILFLSQTFHRMLKIEPVLLQFFFLITIGPLSGSLITEPAAMTITALLLFQMIQRERIDKKLLYGILAILFVNISVGGALTHFAAPPILMVARHWQWQWKDVFFNLGVPAIVTVFVNAALFVLFMKKKIISMLMPVDGDRDPMPAWVAALHIGFLGAVVYYAHQLFIFLLIFALFLIAVSLTKAWQTKMQFRSAALVGVFLASLVILGTLQSWWLEPLMQKLSGTGLYLSAIGLTAVTDNAALTYLGSLVPSLTDRSKWALVSGALAGGGLTILANAPNPAGFAILHSKFDNSALNAAELFLAALAPTLVAALSFYFLGNF
ncbi:MAG: hypothetical protein H7061_06915 [Bdellovibrionaceae bacterium]|nr:hypothetical protein [Bdellovibrio sp.]